MRTQAGRVGSWELSTRFRIIHHVVTKCIYFLLACVLKIQAFSILKLFFFFVPFKAFKSIWFDIIFRSYRKIMSSTKNFYILFT